MAADHPLVVVSVFEGHQSQAQLLDGIEGFDPQEILFEGADETLGDAVALWLAYESRRTSDTQKAEFFLVGVGNELAAVIVAYGQSSGDIFRKGPEMVEHSLT